MGLLWKKELTLENFEDFATEYVKPTYLMAYKATLSEYQASNISSAALSKVFSLREVYADSGENVVPEKAIADAIEPMLTKIQFSNLHNTSISPDENDLPSTEELISIVDKAVDKARAEMPRYAPVYSGTMGVVLIMTMVVVIVAAIALICLNPFAKNAEDGGASADTMYVDSAARIDPEYMVDLSADICGVSADGYEFNTGAVPVMVELSGPDTGLTKYISATDADGAPIKLYQYDARKYCYISHGEGVYRIIATASNGKSQSLYTGIYDNSSVSDGDIVPPNIFIAIPHGQQITADIFDSDKISSAAIVSEDEENTVSSSELAAQLSVIPPQSGTLALSADNSSLIYTAAETAGLDRIVLRYKTDNGEIIDYTVPVMISNAAPVIDASSLNIELVHTPSHNAVTAGKLLVSDSDSDPVTFNLVNTVNCSVMLAPNGSYIASIDKDYTGSFASFTFTATDGLITTDPATVSFTLKNQLLTQLEYTQNFICYAGEYYYTLDLPQEDLDGDKLKWTVITPLTNGLTPNGNEISVSDDGSTILYRISPDLNEDTVEQISLVCTDGWLQSPTIAFLCNISENKPPVSAGGNSINIPLQQAQVECSLNIKDDFELDKCVISGVHTAVGGAVTPNTGWNQLKFTFNPDGTETDCYVILTVKDTLSGKMSNIRYTITREE